MTSHVASTALDNSLLMSMKTMYMFSFDINLQPRHFGALPINTSFLSQKRMPALHFRIVSFHMHFTATHECIVLELDGENTL